MEVNFKPRGVGKNNIDTESSQLAVELIGMNEKEEDVVPEHNGEKPGMSMMVKDNSGTPSVLKGIIFISITSLIVGGKIIEKG